MSFKQLEKFIFEKIAETKLPGLSAALIEGDKMIWSRGFGYRDAGFTSTKVTGCSA